jgi:hypothetical protein
MHPLILLPLLTFILLIGFLVWNYVTTKEHQRTGGKKASGIGSPKDPLA